MLTEMLNTIKHGDLVTYIDAQDRVVVFAKEQLLVIFPWKNRVVFLTSLPSHTSVFYWDNGIALKYQADIGRFTSAKDMVNPLEASSNLTYIEDARTIIQTFMLIMNKRGIPVSSVGIPPDMYPGLFFYLGDPFKHGHLAQL